MKSVPEGGKKGRKSKVLTSPNEWEKKKGEGK